MDKKYETIAIGIGLAALGFTAYQTYIQKEAVDQNPIQQKNKSPIIAAKENIQNAVKSGTSFISGIFSKGSKAAEDAKNEMFSGASGIFHTGTDKAREISNTGSNGLKYLYNRTEDTGNAFRNTVGWFYTKGKSAMGSTYEAARTSIPKNPISFGGLTGIFTAKKEKKPIGGQNKTENWINSFMHPFNTTKAPNDNDPSTYTGISII